MGDAERRLGLESHWCSHARSVGLLVRRAAGGLDVLVGETVVLLGLLCGLLPERVCGLAEGVAG